MKISMNKMILALSLASLLGSCSDQVYSYRKKIRTGPAEKSVAAKENAVIPAPNEQPPTEEASVATSLPISEPTFRESMRTDENTAGPAEAKKVKRRGALKQLKQALKTASPLRLNSEDKVAPKKDLSMEPKKLIVVGLIILLIGVILAIVSRLAGYVVTTVGVVILVIGLILLLLDYL